MNKLLLSVLALGAGVFAAQAEDPIITFHSNAFAEVGESNQFSILLGATESTYVDVDCGSGANEYELKVAGFDSSTEEFTGTWIPIRVNAAGNVSIYGDASKIDVIVINGGYVTDIDMSQCTNLEVLDLEHNSLRSLDLDPFSKLYALYLTDNPFTAQTPLDVNGPKPNLQILEIDIIDHVSPDFNMSDFPALQTFDAYHSTGITHLDPTGCPNLKVLSAEMTAITELDVTKNPELLRLNISETRVTEINLSKNPKLQHLLANHDSGVINTQAKLKNIDLTNNPNLVILNLNGNDLESVNLTNNTQLTNLSLRRNKFTSLNLDNNSALYSVDVMLNDMDYATLPLPRNTFGEYFYEQNAMKVARAQKLGSQLDLSARVLRQGTTTTARLMSKPIGAEPDTLDSSYYSYADGVVTFLKIPADSVYLAFENDVFADYDMTTTPFVVKSAEDFGKPTAIVNFTMPANTTSLAIDATITGPTGKFLVALGGVTDTIEGTSGHIDANIPAGFNGSATILLPEEEVLTGLAIANTELYSINLTAATELTTLALTGCELYSISLTNNRCLRVLDLSGNNLTTLDLTGAYGNYEKTMLTNLNVANNKLKTLTIISTRQLETLNAANNQLTEFDFTNFQGLRHVDFSGNRIAGELSLTYLLDATDIDISGNKITSLMLDNFTGLEVFNVSNNDLTFVTLPAPKDINAKSYIYAPQNPIVLQPKAPAVNLTAQSLGGTTSFVWKNAAGESLVQGVDVDCVHGATKFLKLDLGAVHCNMTNPAFPGLTLTTTAVEPVDAPTNLIATFTGAENATATGSFVLVAKENTAVYIDWRGDGTEYVEYSLTTSPSEFPSQLVAGAQAKMYTYNSADDLTVFSIYGFDINQLDLEQLNSLTCINIGAQELPIANVKLPQGDNLEELTLSGCGMTSYPYGDRFPKLRYLSLANNQFRSFDASIIPQVQILVLSSNLLKSVKFNNPRLWDLHLDNNTLETVDLNGLPDLDQLFLNANYLSTVDVTPVKDHLRVLSLATNCFTFATLPQPDSLPRLSVYYYGMQDPVDVACIDGKVDLSAQAMVGNTPTTYQWFLGEAYLDDDSGLYTGEELIEGEEYTIEGGITSFLSTFSEQVQGVMSNEVFPNLQLLTSRFFVDQTGIDKVSAPDARAPRGVYDLQGRPVVNPGHGLYIVDGKKQIR